MISVFSLIQFARCLQCFQPRGWLAEPIAMTPLLLPLAVLLATFKAVRLEYRRPWEKNVEPAETFAVTLAVSE